jgi:phage terminase large subunit GpA-like protein
MQIRCYRCNWNFAIKRDEIAFVLEALEQSGGNHYDVPCPRCRKTNKISIEQMRSVVPRPSSEAEIEVEVIEEEEEEKAEEKSKEEEEGED